MQKVFVPGEYHKAIYEFAVETLEARGLGGSRARKFGGYEGLVPDGQEPSVDTVIIKITEEPCTPGEMLHTYQVPLNEIV